MRSHASRQRGFTLVEILIVLSLVAILAGMAFLMSFDSYRRTSFHTEEATLVALLQHARAQAMNNVCAGALCAAASAHGVMIENDKYVLFEGVDYASRDRNEDSAIEANPSITYSGLTAVIFEASSGDSLQPGNIILRDSEGHSATITIGSEGQISWNN